MDHYQTLGISRDASPEAIRDAFRELSRRHHPDAAAGDSLGAAGQFQTVKAAYDVLRDPKARAKYDEELAASSTGRTPAFTPHFTWSNIAQPQSPAQRPARGGSGPTERADLDAMIDAYFGRWNEPE